MTEAEWLRSRSPVAMLAHLKDDATNIKSLQYAVAVCLRQPELLTEGLRAWVRDIERVLGGEAIDGLDGVQETAEREAYDLAERGPPGTRAQYAAIADVVFATWVHDTVEPELDDSVPSSELEAVRRANADLVRCIFGNPFRPVAVDPSWLTADVLALAHGIYDDRAFERMPILADALQDAGCDNDDILNHCRGDGPLEGGGPKPPTPPHARGCWVVDLILGKA